MVREFLDNRKEPAYQNVRHTLGRRRLSLESNDNATRVSSTPSTLIAMLVEVNALPGTQRKSSLANLHDSVYNECIQFDSTTTTGTKVLPV